MLLLFDEKRNIFYFACLHETALPLPVSILPYFCDEVCQIRILLNMIDLIFASYVKFMRNTYTVLHTYVNAGVTRALHCLGMS